MAIVDVALVALALVGQGAGNPSGSPSPSSKAVGALPTPLATPSSSTVPDASSTQAVAATPPPTLTPTPELPFDPIKLSGSGNKVARFKIPEDAAAIAVISEKGSSNFVVWTVDSTGSETELLVNTIGSYSGTRLFDGEAGSHSVAFKVESNGKWTITVKPISLARGWPSDSSTTGKGDMVLAVLPPITGLSASTITHKGTENFVVWAYGDEGADLLVNEIGNYRGESLWPSGTFLIEIEADGTWTISAPK